MNFGLIEHAKTFYEHKGFEDIEVPWIVSEEACNITKPPNGSNIYVNNINLYSGHKCLVASGEQGFLQLILDNKLKDGSCYQTTTACFRNEREYNNLYNPYFMKTELIYVDLKQKQDMPYMLDHILRISQDFFRHIGVEAKLHRLGEFEYDIFDKHFNIELGSYGIRNYKDFRWVYGTGLALYRTEEVMRLQREYKRKMIEVPKFFVEVK